MAEYKSEMTASECAESNMTSYAGYTISTKLPNCIDGLKPIHRRILVTLHNRPGVQKEATLVGRVMEMHPHGDASIASAISTMAQPFSHCIPLVFSDSNTGTYVGDESAAARYVDVSESEEAKDLFFNDINSNMYKMVPSESGMGLEPAYLIPKLPTSLLIHSFGIAIAYKTDTFTIAVNDLCKLAKEFIDAYSNSADWHQKKKSLVKYCLPEFPTHCVLRNADALLKAYKRGDFAHPIVLDGILQVKADSIIIKTLPPFKSFGDITFDVGSSIKDKTSYEANHFQQMEDFSGKNQGVMFGNFVSIPRRGLNPFDELAYLKKRVQFTINWKHESRFVDHNGKMSIEDPFTLLVKWYKVRKAAVLGDLKQSLSRMVDHQRQLMALIIVVDYADEVYKIFKEAVNDEATIEPLVKRFNLTRYQAKYLSKLTLSQLTSRGRDDLVKELEKVRQQMKELQEKFTKIDQLIMDSIDKFYNKFAKDYQRRCTIPKYVGYAIYKDTGFIMLESLEEMDHVLKDFGDKPDTLEFHLFSNPTQSTKVGRVIGADEQYDGIVPKYIKAKDFTDEENIKYTVMTVPGGAVMSEGIYPKRNDAIQAVYTSGGFTGITKQGRRVWIQPNEKILRKNINSGASIRDIVHVSPILDDEVIVIHVSSSQTNVIVLERISGEAKLSRIVLGKWFILGVYRVTNDKIIVNVPKEARSYCQTRHVMFENLADTLKPGSKNYCLIGRNGSITKNAFTLEPVRRKSTIMMAKPMVK